jgi:hypothetical protein
VKLAYSRRKSTERASRLCPSVNGLSLSLLWDLWNDAPHLDGLAELYATPARELELIEIFKESSRLETDFWEMGLRMGERVDEQHEPFITPSVGRC